jgi:ABC-type uncharacterized transport system involved in gliding motility auxiliary subunit
VTKVRTIFGAASIAFLLLALNMLAFSPSALSLRVAGPFIVGLGASVAWLVLALSSIVSASKDWRTLGGLNAVASSLLFLGICVVVYAFCSHWDRTFDLTQEGLRELSPQTVQLLQGLDKDVEVFCFFMAGGDSSIAAAQDRTERFMQRCARYGWRLKYEMLDQERDVERLTSLGAGSQFGRGGTIVVKCGQRVRAIQLSDSSPRLEERDFTNALINVVSTSNPKIYFLAGHKERNVEDKSPATGLSSLGELLKRESYAVETAFISTQNPTVPADCNVLVIASPQIDFNRNDLQVIQAYIENGGRLLFTFDPAVAQGQIAETLRPWVEQRFGISVGNDIIISKYGNPSDQILLLDLARSNTLPWPELASQANTYTGSYNPAHPITRGFALEMLLPRVRTVSTKTASKMPPYVSAQELLFTLPVTWAESDIEALYKAQKSTTLKVSPGGNEEIKSLPVAVAATLKTEIPIGDTDQTKDARIVVIGDSDFMTNNCLQQIPGNMNFILNTMAWLTENDQLIAIRPATEGAKAILLSDQDRDFITWFSTLGILTAICVATAIAYALRRRHQ